MSDRVEAIRTLQRLVESAGEFPNDCGVRSLARRRLSEWQELDMKESEA